MYSLRKKKKKTVKIQAKSEERAQAISRYFGAIYIECQFMRSEKINVKIS